MKAAVPAYSPYGYIADHIRQAPMLGYNGERYDPLTDMYALGQGFRSYSPALMRFCRPDELSPFAEGGYNAYAYCAGDPLNYRDDTGQSRDFARLRKMWEDRSRQPVQQMAPRKKTASRMTENRQPNREQHAPRDPAQQKKKVRFSKAITTLEYTKEQIALREHYAIDKKALQDYIQQLTAYKDQKFQDLVFLSTPETFNQAKKLGITDKGYDRAINRIAKSVGEMEDRLRHLNSTLRSYNV
ncbi:RHS repeat-associated core domain-containing protein [Pseudomonas sp. WOUb67]|uniref:RHS repeat-associated core domain-containing protein n=1 Tax=Pseudomonas sp. WOUb67 TaxID=3161136 RepID=UPI003CEBA04D